MIEIASEVSKYPRIPEIPGLGYFFHVSRQFVRLSRFGDETIADYNHLRSLSDQILRWPRVCTERKVALVGFRLTMASSHVDLRRRYAHFLDFGEPIVAGANAGPE